ncbi:P-loop containing nucleoside triphosphate hydrolase [Pseudocohnilembus persalinus]|uniref:p-loop containing nucleoside triphosphate hydrolase n=1 Tax=Pseudocohnilembus persalinus TaxID=266149 RepID=A0A0V0QZA6_PSEPJ|nr:P-loop containing nucleoside triphosphate hydrolase [Pseudocohnilembus persalinus]|eukprot:KRX07590.1 P-loop containing nucleoside triphosphate hydrolase [Pseudocohnilembus persalinus]
MFNIYTQQKKKGCGNASCVGSGKTLTALQVFAMLYDYNIKNNLPLVLQNADGSLTGEIKINSIVISTLGRMREHPLQQFWTLVVIDECLAVQRREALHTQEAWRQIISSQYGVLMMSATFFRTRFDQLFYMLKMLRSGIQENREYLDCILNETITCYINQNQRKWEYFTVKTQLPLKVRQKYDNLLNQEIGGNISSEIIYKQLQDLINNQYSIIQDWKKIIKNLEENDQDIKLLIYAKSKQEADLIAEQMCENVGRFPDVKSGKKHIVASYHEATFGVNTLVKYNAILMRPPEPDKLPQIKGRLDRSGQNKDLLQIHYVVLEDTIEEAGLLRLEMCQQFMNNFIMPIASFYDYAVGRIKK